MSGGTEQPFDAKNHTLSAYAAYIVTFGYRMTKWTHPPSVM